MTCANSINGNGTEVSVGGPVVYSYQGIALVAFDALGKPPRIRRIPVWLAKGASRRCGW
jgi:hypothetical protein